MHFTVGRSLLGTTLYICWTFCLAWSGTVNCLHNQYSNIENTFVLTNAYKNTQGIQRKENSLFNAQNGGHVESVFVGHVLDETSSQRGQTGTQFSCSS